jgi:hypothetical protein
MVASPSTAFSRLTCPEPEGGVHPARGGALWASPALPSVRFPLRFYIFVARPP